MNKRITTRFISFMLSFSLVFSAGAPLAIANTYSPSQESTSTLYSNLTESTQKNANNTPAEFIPENQLVEVANIDDTAEEYSSADPNKIGHIPGILRVKTKEGYDPKKIMEKNSIKKIANKSKKNNPKITKENKYKGKGTISTLSLNDATPAEINAALSELNNDKNIEYAEPMYVAEISNYSSNPNDPIFRNTNNIRTYSNGLQLKNSWYFGSSGLNIINVWNGLNDPIYKPRATGNDIKIAVIDTGFYLNHPDMRQNVVVGKDELEKFTASTQQIVTDYDVTPIPAGSYGQNESNETHGTAVAGMIASTTNNSVGNAGVSYDSKTLVYKVQGYYYLNETDIMGIIMPYFAMENAIYSAVADGAKIINLSLGGNAYSQSLQDAIDYAYSNGVLVFAASGNDSRNGVSYPAGNKNAIAVGSFGYGNKSDSTGVKARSDFTNYGVGVDAANAGTNNGQLDILAPGEYIVTPGNPTATSAYPHLYPNGYKLVQGTSFASPAAAASAALLWRFMPQLTHTELENYLLRTASNGTSPNLTHGHGYINVDAAYNKMKTDYPALSISQITAPSITNSKTPTFTWGAVSGTDVTYNIYRNGTKVASNLSTRSYTSASLSDGTYTFTIEPVSSTSKNWYNNSDISITVDTVVPVITGFSYDGSVSWTHSETGKNFTTEYRVNNGSIKTAPNKTSYSITEDNLGYGTHTISVRLIDTAGNASVWNTYSFTRSVPPTTPNPIPEVQTTFSSSVSVSWDPCSSASTYEYKVNNNAPVVTTSTRVVASGLSTGTNTISVRAVAACGTSSSWASTSVVKVANLTAPVITGGTAISTTNSSTSISWSSVDNATSYEYRINGGTIQTTTLRSSPSFNLNMGNNVFEVRAAAGSVKGSWSSVSINRVKINTSVTLTTPAMRWDKSTYLSGVLRDASGKTLSGKKVVIQRSHNNGSSWSSLATVTTDSLGQWKYTYNPSSSWERAQRIRVRFAGDTFYNASAYTARNLTVKTTMWTPKNSVKTPKRNKTFTVTSYIGPRFASNKTVAKVLFYKQNKNGSWTYVKAASMKTSYVSSTKTKLTGRTYLTAGKWRMRVRYDGAKTNKGYTLSRSYSSYVNFTVK